MNVKVIVLGCTCTLASQYMVLHSLDMCVLAEVLVLLLIAPSCTQLWYTAQRSMLKRRIPGKGKSEWNAHR